jgi:hypothetical protein
MASKQEAERFLKEVHVKIEIFGILFLDDRGKNAQTLHDLEILASERKKLIKPF